MSTGGDVSEQLVRDGMVVAEEVAKIAGSLSKEAIALIIALIKREGQVKGPTPITNLKNHALKTGQHLEIFQLKKSDISKFKKLAKEYGVLYKRKIFPPAFLTRNCDKEKLVDLLALSGDSAAISHIYEKLGYPVPERDSEKNAEARAASEQSSSGHRNGYEKSRPSKADNIPAQGDSVPGSKSVISDIRHFKEQAKIKNSSRGGQSIPKAKPGLVR